MSIKSEIDRLKDNVSAAYSAMETAGAEMPDEQTSANLAATALTLALTAEKIISALGYTPANSNLFPVTSSNIHNSAITRAKLAPDALYSPFYNIGASEPNLTLSVAQLGRKIRLNAGSADVVINVNKDPNIPVGAEYSIFKTWAKTAKIIFTNALVYIDWETNYLENPTLAFPEGFITIALEKMSQDSAYDYWHVIGNVEVVE